MLAVLADLPAPYRRAREAARGHCDLTSALPEQELSALVALWRRHGGSVITMTRAGRPSSRGDAPCLAVPVDETRDGRTIWATHAGLALQIHGTAAREL